MKTFAFLINREEEAEFKPLLEKKRLLSILFAKRCPYRILPLKKGGYIISLLSPSREKSQEAIKEIAPSLRKMQVGIVGFNNFPADLINKGLIYFKNFKIAVTNGASLIAWSLVESTYRLAKTNKINLEKISILVTGRKNSVRELCRNKLKEIFQLNPEQITSEPDLFSCGNKAGISIDVDTNSIELPGLQKTIKGGLIRLPDGCIVQAGLAETMLLALDERFVSYSFGDNINPDQLEEIADIAARHGFEVWAPEAPVI